ncbi:DUF4865 family protein [Silvimonas sp. JCM 19000]
MLAMQYRFTLPADYDMSIIEQRIRAKGPLLDDFDGLILKAWLSSRRDDHALPASENSYAPFYLWQDSAAMLRFVSGAGFKALTRDFGWPVIQTWAVIGHWFAPDVHAAGVAERCLSPIAPYTDLAELHAPPAAAAGLLGWINGFDPMTWQQVKFTLWRSAVHASDGANHAPRWRVGHLSSPALVRLAAESPFAVQRDQRPR